MRLKNIKLAGFKSFVDPTTVPFNKNLIAVVGPNGCGKSNIVDAIRWVMGESSAKTLRGESMADVIFNGSTSRKPVGQASVQLTFDNSDGAIGGEYAQYAEIAIKRVASRDGTSNYYLNSTKCRRKDITDVFLGTGLGPRSYSVIEQGMISRFIEAKPDDLRVYLEEAAGISKYKERRRETETRIRHSRENLERVQDLRDEIGKQLEKLHRQAKAAERYKVLKQDERLNKAQLLTLQWQALDTQLQSFDSIIKETEVKIEERVAKQRHYGAEVEKQREVQNELSDELNEIQGRYYGLGAEIAKVEQSITHHKERYQQLQDDQNRIEESTGELQQNTQNDQRRLTDYRQELASVEPRFVSAQQSHTNSVEALQKAETDLQQWRQQWNEFSSDAAKTLQTAEVEQTRIKHTETTLKNTSERIEKLTTEQEGLDFTALAETVASAEEMNHEIATEHEAAQERLQQLKVKIDTVRQNNETQQRVWDSGKEKLQASKGRQASLAALQQAALGKNEKAVSWLTKNELHNNPRLLEQLNVTSGWEKAVETVLGPHLEAVCIDNMSSLDDVLNDMPESSVEFFLSKTQSNNDSFAAESLASKIEGSSSVANMVQQVFCADSLGEAKKIQASLQENQSVITQDGIWLGKAWVRIAKDKDAKAGMLQREKELQSLNANIDQLENEVSSAEEQVINAKEILHEAESERETLQRDVNQLNQKRADFGAQFQVKQQQLEQGKNRERQIATELEDQHIALTDSQDALQKARNTWQHALSNSEQHATRKIELETLGNQFQERYTSCREQGRLNAENKHQLEVKVEQLKPQINSLQESIERSETQLKVMFERSAMLAESLGKGEGPVAELQQELESILGKRVTVEQELMAIRAKVEEVTHSIRQQEEAKESISLAVETMRRKLEEQRLEGRTLEVRKNTFKEQVEEIDYQLSTVIDEMPEHATIHAWQEEAEKIAIRISRLGAINLAAIEEFKVQEERKNYLDAQYNDLTEALETLENAIRKIDKETRTRFKEIFDKVNVEFQRLFPKVFGGGSAHLELTGDDLLDTGISVMARPPGKRNTTIHLLSGGEKALTAVSLVFAIFHLNPAPFCLLDEVDAPLDDANVIRFCALVKEMSEKVQFLFISHNKIAIEMANQLTGVTMHEPGVSRIVAVDMEEAVQMAAA